MKPTLLMAAITLMLGGVFPRAAVCEEASVQLGEDGKLQYTPDERGNLIPDFSRAGYMGGGVKIPDVRVKLTLKPRPDMNREMEYYSPSNAEAAGDGDDRQRIQEAIDRVSRLPLDSRGFRGAVLLKKGLYRVKGSLYIRASGVVLRGEGQGKDGTIILATDTKQHDFLIAEGKRQVQEVPRTRVEIADEYVPWGVKSFNLKSTRGLSLGDKVVVHRPKTVNWYNDIGQERWIKDSVMAGGDRQFDFERTIVALNGTRITLDAPTVNAMQDKYGGGFVYKYTDKGAISHVGIEHLRLVSAYVETGKKGIIDENHGWDAVHVQGCVNSWVRNVTSVHFGHSCIQITRKSKFITIQDCAYLEPISYRGGGRRHSFSFNNNSFCIMQRCYSSKGGRHCNSASACVPGPNVYLDNFNRGDDAGPHHRWSMGILYDNVTAYNLVANNRGSMGSGHGFTGAQIVFWNCVSGKRNIAQPLTARNYSIGNINRKNGQGEPVSPRSLYLTQLEERLGRKAVENVTTEGQRKAVTDAKSELSREKLIWDAIRLGIGEEDRENAK